MDLDKLNDAQRESVVWDSNLPLLVLAGAGSGKTRILTHRIAQFIDQGVPSYNILGVTFTNKAAKEMLHRVERLVQSQVWISTFHSTCMRILRQDAEFIEGMDRNFVIYDDYDQLQNIKESMKILNINEKQVNPKAVREQIGRAKDYLITPPAYAAEAADYFETQVARVYDVYEQRLLKQKALDFGDLIMKTVFLFERHPRVLESWQERFKYILIDEYQDTNHAQYKLINLLAAKYKNLTVVGDPDQSIYAWRGADIRNILNFEKDYPDCGVIRMEQNYRSGPMILSAANALINRNSDRKPKELWTDRTDQEPIEIFEACDETEEGRQVVKKVMFNRSRGIPLAEQVVFYRVHAQSRVIEDSLRRMNIPYKIVGGVRFYDRKEIKDVIAYLRIIANPDDETSLKRVINVPTRGLGKKALETIEHHASLTQRGWDDALANVYTVEGLSPRAKKSAGDFHAWLTKLRKLGDKVSVRELLERILDETGYVSALEAERTTEAGARLENIEEFFTVIDDFEENPPAPMPKQDGADELIEPTTQLLAFLEQISLVTNLDGWDEGTDVLTLMTLHTAKGLEFPHVFMVGMEEGIFPHGNSMGQGMDELEEERRLCYVGITRAQKKLYMSYATCRRLYGQVQHNLPSRFLTEIPTENFTTDGGRKAFSSGMDDLDDFDDVTIEEDPDIEFDIPDDEIKKRILFD